MGRNYLGLGRTAALFGACGWAYSGAILPWIRLRSNDTNTSQLPAACVVAGGLLLVVAWRRSEQRGATNTGPAWAGVVGLALGLAAFAFMLRQREFGLGDAELAPISLFALAGGLTPQAGMRARSFVQLVTLGAWFLFPGALAALGLGWCAADGFERASVRARQVTALFVLLMATAWCVSRPPSTLGRAHVRLDPSDELVHFRALPAEVLESETAPFDGDVSTALGCDELSLLVEPIDVHGEPQPDRPRYFDLGLHRVDGKLAFSSDFIDFTRLAPGDWLFTLEVRRAGELIGVRHAALAHVERARWLTFVLLFGLAVLLFIPASSMLAWLPIAVVVLRTIWLVWYSLHHS